MAISDEREFAPQTYIDDEGRFWEPYSISYDHAGSSWSFQIMAIDFDDARARVASLATAKVDGKLVASIPTDKVGEYLARKQARLN